MSRRHDRAGMTLVEVLIAVVLVSVAATLVYNSGISSYKMLMRSRQRLEAQGIAFDKLWAAFNMKYDVIQTTNAVTVESAPTQGAFPPGGVIRTSVLPCPLPQIDYYEITVQVWAPSNNPLFSVMNSDGTVKSVQADPLVEYTVLRYPGER